MNPVSLDALLHALCQNISPAAKLILLIDGCRSEPGKEPSEKPPPIHWPPRLNQPDFLQFYACLPGFPAHEIDLGSGCAQGRFSMVLLQCMQDQNCKHLSSLIKQVRSEVPKFDKFRSKQKPCIYSTWDHDSAPNFFNETKLHVRDVAKKMETIQKGVDECRGQHWRVHQELEKQLQEVCKERDKLTSQKRQLEEECAKLRQTLLFLEKDKDANKEEISRLNTELTEKYRELREKEDELNDKTFECQCLQKRLAARKERLKEAEDARTKLEKREHASVPQESYSQIKQERDNLKQDNDNLREENSKLKQLVEEGDWWKEVKEVSQSAFDAGQSALNVLGTWTSAELQEGDVHQNHSLLQERAGSREQLTMPQKECRIKEDDPHSWWNPFG